MTQSTSSIRSVSLFERFAAWPLNREVVVALLLAAVFFLGARLSPGFLDGDYLINATSLYIDAGLIALPMTLIIITGQIDLSVASTLALTSCVTAVLFDHFGLPLPAAMVIGLLLGALLGLVNGLLVAVLRLPSLAVTLGTFALYRGLAQILLGDRSISRFPEWFTGIDSRYFPGPFPIALTLFLVMAVGFGLLLHRSVAGRWIIAAGVSPDASRYSGVPVAKLTIALYTLTGLIAALGGLIMTSRLGSARFDMGLGKELDVITAVVLGGTDTFGGRGTILGTVMALFLVGLLQSALGLASVKAETQLICIGMLLLVSLLLPVAFKTLAARRK